jgi:Xaa-Pro aminopeptidase
VLLADNHLFDDTTDLDTLHVLESDHPDHQQQLLSTHLGQHQQQQAQQLAALQALHSQQPMLHFNTAFLEAALHRHRAVKTPAEIGCVLRASQGSAAAHRALWAACRPGVYEYQLEAAFVHECLKFGNMQLG